MQTDAKVRAMRKTTKASPKITYDIGTAVRDKTAVN